MLNKIEVCESR